MINFFVQWTDDEWVNTEPYYNLRNPFSNLRRKIRERERDSSPKDVQNLNLLFRHTLEFIKNVYYFLSKVNGS